MDKKEFQEHSREFSLVHSGKYDLKEYAQEKSVHCPFLCIFYVFSLKKKSYAKNTVTIKISREFLEI